MDTYSAKLHISVVVELELEADSAMQAEAIAKDHENIISHDWGASKAVDQIKVIRELSYCSSIAVIDKKPKELTLG